ncbi:MAG: M67 family metallopeptidase [Bacillota bacterium]|nr:M67 family metallopeptidase [Bacillota bacterium]
MITLKREDYETILAHARACLPEEACGLLGGVIDQTGNKRVEKVYLLENTDHSSEHFTLSPQAQLAAVKDMRANGCTPLGNWHSHPSSPSRPSQEDKRLAFDSKASYMILSLQDGDAPVLHSFHIEGGMAEQEELVYV